MAPSVQENSQFVRDKELSNSLHGKQINTKKSGFASMAQKDSETNRAVVDSYLGFWAKDSDKRSKLQTDEDKDTRLENYTSLTNSYYNIATDLYEYGWGQSFHFARYYPGESFYQAIARHEHYLAHLIGIKAGMKVLDVGCGVGGPAREIAHFTGAHITGINNNDYQIERAKQYSKKVGLENQTNFVKGNFMKMDFEPESFDAVYAIEATVHAPSLEGVYGEIYKVLKPGGIFGVYEWVMTDEYDETNPEHKRIARDIEIGDGIPQMVKAEVAKRALETVGFQIFHEEDLADKGDKYPWYYPLEGDLRNIQSLWDLATCFRMTKFGRNLTQTMLGLFEKIGLAAKGSKDAGDVLIRAADGLVAGGKKKLFTPMMMYVCKKPERNIPTSSHTFKDKKLRTYNGSAQYRSLKISLLNDTMHLCLLRRDIHRAARILSILVVCKEVTFHEIWELAIAILNSNKSPKDIQNSIQNAPGITFNEKEKILIDVTLYRIQRKEYQLALDEIQDYLPMLPYLDSPALHLYAAMLYIALMFDESIISPEHQNLFRREAIRYLSRSIMLSTKTKENNVNGDLARSLLAKIKEYDSKTFNKNLDSMSSSEEEIST